MRVRTTKLESIRSGASGFGLLLVLTVIDPALAAESIRSVQRLVPEPIYRLISTDGAERFATRGQVAANKARTGLEKPAFLAVRTNEWPAALVPIFAVETENHFELRRLPTRGLENSSEPLFFALPAEDEPEAVKLAGHWDFLAIRGDGSKASPALEMTTEAGLVAAWFSQFTDYRFAHVTEGSFQSDQLNLRIEYIADSYLLKGTWREGVFKGEWRHVDNSERGKWEASREPPQIPASTNVAALYEWRQRDKEVRRYLLEGERIDGNWERAPRPLCRVWRSETSALH